MTRFWLGGYGPEMDGSAEGIGFLAGDEGREAKTLGYRDLAAPVSSPSWLAKHPSLDVVYAALEHDGAVQAFARSGEATLASLGDPVPVGDAVCHVAIAPNGSTLIASCYGDGRIVRLGLAPDGRIVPAQVDAAAALRAALFGDGDPDAVRDEPGVGAAASDPYSAPGRASHAHAAAFLRDGRIVTTDLGFDLVRFWRPTGTGLALDHEVVLPLGVGPRHLVVHPSGHVHVVTEFSCEVFTLASGPDGRYGVASSTLSSPIAQVGVDFAAELTRTRDGAFLYTALRGSNTIAALRVLGGGERLESVALADSGVDWPRHHLVFEGKLVVAGQRSDTISLIDLDERTGAPLGIRHQAPAATPTCIVPVA